MATIYVDNKPYTVKDGQNLLQACLGLGFNIPYFCWHPALGSVGACRLCAVKQFKDENGHARKNRHGLHDPRGRRHADLDRRSGGEGIPRRGASNG